METQLQGCINRWEYRDMKMSNIEIQKYIKTGEYNWTTSISWEETWICFAKVDKIIHISKLPISFDIF